MYRVIACDLDGTLLRDDKTISPETAEILEEINRKGVLFLPSTGRTHRELPEALRGQPFVNYALCCNGGTIYDYIQDRYIFEDAIPYQLALEVLRFIQHLPVFETVVINGERIVKGDENDEICEYIKKVAVKGLQFNFQGAHDVAEAFAKRHRDAQKMLLYLAEGADRQQVMDAISQRFPELLISSSGPLFIEVNIKGVDKGKALKRFCQLMDIPIEESIAFGDAENDISMLDAAGLAVVMENGTPETRKHADLICPSNMNDGVRKTIEEIWK
jgi:Cof subfamily protein (haloacid dehalogenase superfamily)